MATTPDPVQFPKVSIDGTEYEVKFTCEDIILLKKNEGIDVLANNPAKRKLQRHAQEALAELRRLESADKQDHEAIAAARDRLDDAQDAMAEDNGNWQHPLDRLDVEQRMVLLEYGLRRSSEGKLTRVTLAQSLPFEHFIAVHNAVSQAILKASAQTTQKP